MSTKPQPPWAIRLSASAESDYQQIIGWTARQFGARQARAYAATLDSALLALAGGPAVAGARARDDIATGLWSLHVARGRRKGRHFVIFRVAEKSSHRVIEVLRLLHDAMDLQRHLGAAGD